MKQLGIASTDTKGLETMLPVLQPKVMQNSGARVTNNEQNVVNDTVVQYLNVLSDITLQGISQIEEFDRAKENRSFTGRRVRLQIKE